MTEKQLFTVILRECWCKYTCLSPGIFLVKLQELKFQKPIFLTKADPNLFMRYLRKFINSCFSCRPTSCSLKKMSEYGIFSGLYCPIFKLNTKIYFISLFSSNMGKYVWTKNVWTLSTTQS